MIGLVVIAIIITVGPVTNASINPARALGPLLISALNGSVHNWTEQLFAYIPGNLIGATIAAFAYDAVAKPRLVARPINEAVTEPDPCSLAGVGLERGERSERCDRNDEEAHQRPRRRRQGVARGPGCCAPGSILPGAHGSAFYNVEQLSTMRTR